MPIARRSLLRVVLAVVVAAGCSPSEVRDGTPPPTPRIGGTWTAVRIRGVAAIPMNEARVQFTLEGRVQGVTGCSEFDAPARILGNAISIGQVERVAGNPDCPAPVRQQEDAFVAVLRTADRIDELGRGRLRVSGPAGEIVLLREGKENFDLTADEQALLADLRRGPWTIVEAKGLPDDVPLPPVEFGESLFAAVGMCGMTGEYRLRGHDLVLFHGMSPSDAEPCPPTSDRLRARLMESLAVVTHLELDDGGRLILRGGDVEIVLAQR